MEEILIRAMKSSDKAAVEQICLATASDYLNSTEELQEYTLLMYNRYYTRMLEDSFVAVNFNDEPIGYILCAPDYDTYKSSFYRNELKQIKNISMFKCISALGEIAYMKRYVKEYPAHLHIDILPQYQHMGIGHSLMNHLFAHLKSNSAAGVMLTVSSSNKNAILFYKKCGFKIIARGAGVVFGFRF